jgi:hypothetical protein
MKDSRYATGSNRKRPYRGPLALFRGAMAAAIPFIYMAPGANSEVRTLRRTSRLAPTFAVLYRVPSGAGNDLQHLR